MNDDLVGDLYKEHNGKAFYNELHEYMISSPVQVLLLERENAVSELRNLMPSIRKVFGESVTKNAIHGSDSIESAKREIALFFKSSDSIER